MLMEAMCYEEDQTTFLTLTYKNENLPNDEKQAKRSVQLWLKRLRKSFPEKQIRYVAALETGTSNTRRYHFHVILYGIKFSMVNKEVLQQTWGNGFIDWKPASPGRMHYVLKYVIKGGVFLMSRKPGIGFGMIEAIQRSLEDLSVDERKKLFGAAKTFYDPHTIEPIQRFRVGGYDYPLHPYLKSFLVKPPIMKRKSKWESHHENRRKQEIISEAINRWKNPKQKRLL